MNLPRRAAEHFSEFRTPQKGYWTLGKSSFTFWRAHYTNNFSTRVPEQGLSMHMPTHTNESCMEIAMAVEHSYTWQGHNCLYEWAMHGHSSGNYTFIHPHIRMSHVWWFLWGSSIHTHGRATTVHTNESCMEIALGVEHSYAWQGHHGSCEWAMHGHSSGS